MGQELRIGRLPSDIEATLCLIREDVMASKAMLARQKDNSQDDDTMFVRNPDRERRIVLCCFERDEIDELLLYWYVKQVDKYAADLEDDYDAYTYAAFKVYVDLRMMTLIRGQERADRKKGEQRSHKREPVNYANMARSLNKKDVSNGKKSKGYGNKG